MIQEMNLSQVIDRLEALENEVKSMKVNLPSQPEQYHFEFIISVDGQEVWSGLNLQEQCAEIFRKQPDAQIAIDWRSSPVVLV
jgi:hypothetical protein